MDGTDGLSVEKSCGHSACCGAVFGGLLFHAVRHVCAGANGLSKDFASFRQHVFGLWDCGQVCWHFLLFCRHVCEWADEQLCFSLV